MEKKIHIKPHRLLILTYLYPYLTLLIYPAIRGLLNYHETGVLTRLIIGEVLASLLAVGIAVLKYKLCSITLAEEKIVICKGLFYRTRTAIPAEKIVLVTSENNPFYALFGVVNLKVYTDAGVKGGADICIPMHKKNAAMIMNGFDAATADLRYASGFWKVLLMAAATSSAATGLLIAAPIINQAGSIIGETLNRLLIEKVLQISKQMPREIPRIAGIISLILLVGYGVALLNGLLKNIGFRVYKKDSVINIRAGILPRRSIVFDLQTMHAVVSQQNWFMRLLGHYSVKISVGGYGEKRRESPVFLPAVTKPEMKRVLSAFVPELPKKSVAFTPPPITLLRFLTPPLLIFALILPVRALLTGLFPKFADVIEFFAVVAAVIDLLFAVCQLVRFKHSGFSLQNYLVCVGGGIFTFKSITAKSNDIEEIIVTRFLPDFISGFCRTTFKIRDKNRDKLTVTSLKHKEVQTFLHETYRLEQ
ncbi:MAG: PH domain-containing protein [Clostridia bacterium]|nr:PH domain-containing protein [Clostridia bacterium]